MRDWQDSLREHADAQHALGAVLDSQLDPAITMLQIAILAGNKIMLCGNGGSAAEAQHIAAELVGRFHLDRRAYSAIALSADTSILTAIGNDYGYNRVFARQVQAHGKPGDVLMALSTSGRSKNVIEAIIAAKFIGMPTLGISGRLGLDCDVDICIPSTTTARIQELSLLCGHLIIEGLEQRLPK